MRQFARLIAGVFLGLMMLSTNGLAASSAWQDLGGGKARLLALLNPQTDMLEMALQVELEPGWSTYWRYPGSSGIPPQFDFSQTRGFLPGEIGFPVPQLLGSNGQTYAGYKGGVIFPLKGPFDAALAADIKLSILIGVCATVCIPAQASFTVSASQLTQSDPQASQLIARGNRALPRTVEASSVLEKKQLVGGNRLQLTITSPDRATTDLALFVEGPADWFLTPAKLLAKNGQSATFEVDLSAVPAGTDIAATRLNYTFRTGENGLYFMD